LFLFFDTPDTVPPRQKRLGKTLEDKKKVTLFLDHWRTVAWMGVFGQDRVGNMPVEETAAG
jgi:hypothetical protein